MSKCYSARCQQERKLIRREFNKWTKNVLLQIGKISKIEKKIPIFCFYSGLETISKNHFDFEINLFDQNRADEPIDFDPNQVCLFCLNRQECLSNKNHIDPIVNEDENSPLDLSLKSTAHLK